MRVFRGTTNSIRHTGTSNYILLNSTRSKELEVLGGDREDEVQLTKEDKDETGL